MPLVAVGETEAEAEKVIEGVFWYVTHNKSEPQFRAPPGYNSRKLYADFLSGRYSGGRTDAIRRKGVSYFRENHVAIYGTPDSVVRQIRSLYDKVGGFGHLIAMLHSGDMDYKTTARSMTLLAREVLPQICGSGHEEHRLRPARRTRSDRRRVTQPSVAAEDLLVFRDPGCEGVALVLPSGSPGSDAAGIAPNFNMQAISSSRALVAVRLPPPMKTSVPAVNPSLLPRPTLATGIPLNAARCIRRWAGRRGHRAIGRLAFHDETRERRVRKVVGHRRVEVGLVRGVGVRPVRVEVPVLDDRDPGERVAP